MSSPAAFIGMLVFWTLAPAVTTVALIYLLLVMVGLAPTPYDCITETRGRVASVSGFDFDIREAYCDTLAKTATISVFASRSDKTRRALLFKFFPLVRISFLT
jgi:hypothetical protein